MTSLCFHQVFRLMETLEITPCLEGLTQWRFEEASLNALLNVTQSISQDLHRAADHLRSATSTTGGLAPELL